MGNKKKRRRRRRIRPLFYITILLLFADGILLGILAYAKWPTLEPGIRNTAVTRVTPTRLETASPDTLAAEISAETFSQTSMETPAAQTPVETPTEYQIEDFEIIYQNPELPTGCEITALTMVLRYYGFDADKITMASEYLPTAEALFYYGSDGLKYGPDLNQYFVGDPFSSGYICGTTAIVTAADDYLTDVGSDMTAHDLTGFPADELYGLVSQDIPVVVWVTIDMTTRYTPEGWYTEDGEWVEWSSNDHGAVLIGYTQDTVTIADPISGTVEYDKDTFESVFSSRGNQCVILQ